MERPRASGLIPPPPLHLTHPHRFVADSSAGAASDFDAEFGREIVERTALEVARCKRLESASLSGWVLLSFCHVGGDAKPLRGWRRLLPASMVGGGGALPGADARVGGPYMADAKKKPTFSKFRRRWCVLQGSTLTYFRGSKCARARALPRPVFGAPSAIWPATPGDFD